MGEWDVYITLAALYHWTPDQVDALDVDYFDELMARIQAEGELQEKAARKAKREARKNGK